MNTFLITKSLNWNELNGRVFVIRTISYQGQNHLAIALKKIINEESKL